MEITVDTIAIALSGMPSDAFFASDQIVRNSFRHQATAVKPLVDAAFAAGRESMREDVLALESVFSRNDYKESYDEGYCEACRNLFAAIRALPIKDEK